MTSNRQVTLKSYTDDVPGPANFEIIDGPVPTPGPGEALCRTLYLSLDPYVRVVILPPTTQVPTSGGPLPLGSVVVGRGVSEIVESNIEGLEPGDLVSGETGWQSYSITNAENARRIDGITPPSAALGVLGMPGFTAWSGLRFVGRPEPGDTVVVSAASGAVGSLVAQLARRFECRVIGIAGSAEKCAWVKDELGADECLSHRSETLADDLRAVTPEGVDVYFDNVGGDVLEAVLPCLNAHARIVVCGRISHLHDDGTHADRLPNFLGKILTRQLVVQGFGWTEFVEHWDEFVDEVAPAVASGEIRFREDVVTGLAEIPAAFGRLFDGSNFGKLVVEVDAS
jgi:NADPH-dependent curcumin reductase CurA